MRLEAYLEQLRKFDRQRICHCVYMRWGAVLPRTVLNAGELKGRQ